MTHEIEVKTTKTVQVKYLRANCGVRYWEDGVVNGEVDNDDGDLIPLRDDANGSWRITIDLDSGTILDWPKGVTASVHYKVCDAGNYALLDGDMQEVVSREGYVPHMLAPCGEGYGDYVIMDIDGNGRIDGWKADLSYFEE